MHVTAYGIEKESLSALLGEAGNGKAQLPDFQRGWVWDDERIRKLIASISLGYPIGAVMMLRTGGDGIRFQHRPLEGGSSPRSQAADRLILDGQQRLTSLFQSLQLQRPVKTRDQRGREVERWYYIDMREALNPDADREEAIISLPADKRITASFGREVLKDYSDPEREYEDMLFPLSKVFDANKWIGEFMRHWVHDDGKLNLWLRFNEEILDRFKHYQVPVIELGQDTPKEAICQVFEKVNTGGVTLTVFELLTAMFAADEFPLRTDWERRERELHAHSILSGVSSTDFLQALTLLATWDRQREARASGSDEDRLPRIGCKRPDMLKLQLDEYQRWADPLMGGFERAAKFLHSQHVYDARFLPYGSQLIPLAAILTILDEHHDAESLTAKRRLARWYWCGVFGELYGGSTETRFARDLPEVISWIRGEAGEPGTIYDAEFAEARLVTLRTRNSAAYKGVYALLLREGARDWITGDEIKLENYFDDTIDIHHIFPQKWCSENDVEAARCDSIINKTPLSSRTNRRIGGKAPSLYLQDIARSQGEQISGTATTVDDLVRSHLVDPDALRLDDFDSHFQTRRAYLLAAIQQLMGKRADRAPDEAQDSPPDAYEVVQEDSQQIEEISNWPPGPPRA